MMSTTKIKTALEALEAQDRAIVICWRGMWGVTVEEGAPYEKWVKHRTLTDAIDFLFGGIAQSQPSAWEEEEFARIQRLTANDDAVFTAEWWPRKQKGGQWHRPWGLGLRVKPHEDVSEVGIVWR